MPFKRFESPEFENNSKVDAYPTLAKTRIKCNAFTKLHELRKDNPFRIMICQIDINPKRNKFDTFKGLIYNIVDSLLISEIKIDDPFPTAKFCIDGHSSPYRLDRNSKWRVTFLYVREDIPSKIIKVKLIDSHFEGLFFVKIIIRSKKWLLQRSYNANNSNISNHLNIIGMTT